MNAKVDDDDDAKDDNDNQLQHRMSYGLFNGSSQL
jgi:hypothetical protein